MPTHRQKGPKGACDTLFSLIVRQKGECERCGLEAPRQELQCAHIVSRRYSATRTLTEPLNAWCLCPKCHWTTTQDGVEFARLVDATIGMDAYEELRQIAWQGTGTKIDWSEERKRLKRVADEMGVVK